jgi:hypothetical protein
MSSKFYFKFKEANMRLIAAISLITLTACSGEMTGQVRGTGQKVVFQYEQQMDHDVYTAVVGGETFRGKAIMDGQSSTTGNVFGANMQTFFGTSTTNRFLAVLLGDKGSSMNCQMRYADSSGITSAGGIGICMHSDGRTIDIVW